MSSAALGTTLDLHGGGNDLIFPHHECEIAQSESLSDAPFSRHWVHSAMVSYDGEKMSKSLGNLVFVSDLLKVADPRAVRLALMRHHYRAGFEWYDTDLEEGTALLHRLLAAAERTSGADPRPFAARVRDRHRRRPRRADRARGARRPRQRDPLRRRRRRRARACCASSAASSASTSIGRSNATDLRISRGARKQRAGNVDRTMSAPDTITVTLPDGTPHDFPRGTTPAEVAASIGAGLAKAAIAARADGDWVDLDRPLERDTKLAIVTPNTPDGREVLRHSTAHVMAQAVTDLFPGAQYAIGPAIADGFYYDFLLPDGRHFTEDDLERIEARMREIVAADQPFLRAEVDRDEGLRLFADQPYKIEIIERVDPDDASEVGEGPRHLRLPQPARRRGPLRRPVPRPARPVHEAARRVQAHEGGGRLLAGRREAPDAPAHLRHRVGGQEGARGAPPPARGGRAARPPQARRRARPLLLPVGDRQRARRVPPQGRDGPQADGGLLAPAARGGRLRLREHAAHHEVEPVRDLRPPRLVRRRHVPADDARRGRGRGHAVLAEADELPVPHPHLPEPHPFLP